MCWTFKPFNSSPQSSQLNWDDTWFGHELSVTHEAIYFNSSFFLPDHLIASCCRTDFLTHQLDQTLWQLNINCVYCQCSTNACLRLIKPCCMPSIHDKANFNSWNIMKINIQNSTHLAAHQHLMNSIHWFFFPLLSKDTHTHTLVFTLSPVVFSECTIYSLLVHLGK